MKVSLGVNKKGSNHYEMLYYSKANIVDSEI